MFSRSQNDKLKCTEPTQFGRRRSRLRDLGLPEPPNNGAAPNDCAYILSCLHSSTGHIRVIVDNAHAHRGPRPLLVLFLLLLLLRNGGSSGQVPLEVFLLRQRGHCLRGGGGEEEGVASEKLPLSSYSLVFFFVCVTLR